MYYSQVDFLHRTAAKHYCVAIITPYTNHGDELPIFLKNIHYFLAGQPTEYEIFIIEQTPGQQLNQGTLLRLLKLQIAMEIK